MRLVLCTDDNERCSEEGTPVQLSAGVQDIAFRPRLCDKLLSCERWAAEWVKFGLAPASVTLINLTPMKRMVLNQNAGRENNTRRGGGGGINNTRGFHQNSASFTERSNQKKKQPKTLKRQCRFTGPV